MLVDLKSARIELGNLGDSTLRRWIAEGRVPAVRLGRRVFIRREVLVQLVQTAERQPREIGARGQG